MIFGIACVGIAVLIIVIRKLSFNVRSETAKVHESDHPSLMVCALTFFLLLFGLSQIILELIKYPSS